MRIQKVSEQTKRYDDPRALLEDLQKKRELCTNGELLSLLERRGHLGHQSTEQMKKNLDIAIKEVEEIIKVLDKENAV